MMISGTLRDAIRSDLDRWEGFFAWMYLDSVGLVTIGYGTMLPNPDAASSLVFAHKNGRAATSAEIKASYDVLASGSVAQKAAEPKHKHMAKHYESITDLRITQALASRLRDGHVDADYKQLKLIYKNFDAFPDAAKVALFDMIYNVGGGHGKTRHHRASGLRAYAGMNMAITRGDWISAAQHSHRRGIPSARNTTIAALFKSCAAVNIRNAKAAK